MSLSSAIVYALLASSMSQPAALPDQIILGNNRVRRTISLTPFVGTISVVSVESGQEFIRAVEPEAKIVIDGKEWWLGGSDEKVNRAYIDANRIPSYRPCQNSLPLVSCEKTGVSIPIPHEGKGSWSPASDGYRLRFANETIEADLIIGCHRTLPVITKEVIVRNRSQMPIRVNQVVVERLAMVEGESQVERQGAWRLPDVTVLSDLSFGGRWDSAVSWKKDPAYETQVSYLLETPCVLEVAPPTGPGADLKPGETLQSNRSYLVVHPSSDPVVQRSERKALFAAYAPWVLDNPLMLHIRSNDDAEIKRAIDQAAECGFEMAIMSFGSGLNMEDVSNKNIARFKALREYANAKGVRFGGYSLLASRRIDDANDVINPKTGKTGGAIFGNSPCLCSEWGQRYFANVKKFIEETGFQVLEHDGNYPGDVCASTSHPGHRDLEDSQWRQFEIMRDFYAWCRSRKVFLNVPDNYFLAGSNKSAMGYRETNWSLPREQQHLHARQNLFDGTKEKLPSMGWMFVPLVEYHGGGAAATIEPLKDHLPDYEMHFANTLGWGAQACWRGTRLYDAPETKAMVLRMVGWFKSNRELLESDISLARRADGRRIDFVTHSKGNKHITVVYNPTEKPLQESMPVLEGSFKGVRKTTGEGRLKVQGKGIQLDCTVPPNGWIYLVFETR